MVRNKAVLSTIGILVPQLWQLSFYSKMPGMMYYFPQGSSYI